MPGKNHYHQSYRSFFWPVILLGTGVIWLLSNLNIIPSENLWILLRLWPVLIIVAGLDVLFARRFPVIGALFALLVIGGVVYVLLFGADFDIEGKPDLQMQSFVVDGGNTTLANIDLNLSIHETFIHPLTDPTNLIDAQVNHFGEVDFSVTGEEHKWIRLTHRGVLSIFPWFLPEVRDADLSWSISLSPEVPLNLSVDAGTGRSVIDLSGLHITRFELDGGTGASQVILGHSDTGYETYLDAGTGSLDIIFPEQSNQKVYLQGSTGRIKLQIPENSAVQIEVLRGGTGDLVLPAWISRVSGRDGRGEGVYQSAGFNNADRQIIVVVENIRTGNIIVE